MECFNTQIATLDLRPCPKLLRLIREVEPDDCGIFWEYNLTVDEQIWRLQIGKETTLIPGELPSVTLQPKSVSVAVDTMASFVVAAEGDGLSYQWQYRTSASGSWSNTALSGNKTATLSFKAPYSRNGYQYRCKVSNDTGTVYTRVVTLKVSKLPVITDQPDSQVTTGGTTVKLSVKAEGVTSYQWYYRPGSSGAWLPCTGTGAKTATLSVYARVSESGYQYRCKLTNDEGSVNTRSVTLTVKER